MSDPTWGLLFQIRKEFWAGDIGRNAAIHQLIEIGYDDFGAEMEIQNWEWHGSAEIPPKPPIRALKDKP